MAPRHKLRPAAGDTGDCTYRLAGPFTLDAGASPDWMRPVQVDARLVQVGCRPVTGSLLTIFGAPHSSIGRSHPICDNIFQIIECSTCYGAPPLPA
jgi:hypothetical protein